MKKIFSIIAILFLLNFNVVNMYANTVIATNDLNKNVLDNVNYRLLSNRVTVDENVETEKIYKTESSTEKAVKKTEEIEILTEEVDEFSNNIEIYGNLPIIKSNVEGFDFSINDKIIENYNYRLEEVKKTNVKKFSFDFIFYQNEEIYSLVVKYTVENLITRSYVDTYNFTIEGEEVYINDLFGEYGNKILTNFINNNFEMNMENENESISNIEKFYFDNKELNLVFDSGILNQVHEDFFVVDVELEDINYKTIKKSEYYTKAPFNVKMINIKEICDFFEYDFEKVADNEILITKDESNYIINVSEENDVDNYVKNNKNITLETTPKIINETLYVPITYLTDVLGLVYFVDEDDSITISSIR